MGYYAAKQLKEIYARQIVIFVYSFVPKNHELRACCTGNTLSFRKTSLAGICFIYL